MMKDKMLIINEWAYMHLPKCKYKLQFKIIVFFEAMCKFGGLFLVFKERKISERAEENCKILSHNWVFSAC